MADFRLTWVSPDLEWYTAAEIENDQITPNMGVFSTRMTLRGQKLSWIPLWNPRWRLPVCEKQPKITKYHPIWVSLEPEWCNELTIDLRHHFWIAKWQLIGNSRKWPNNTQHGYFRNRDDAWKPNIDPWPLSFWKTTKITKYLPIWVFPVLDWCQKICWKWPNTTQYEYIQN